MNNEINRNFLKNSFFGIQLIPVSFLLNKLTWKLLFWYGEKLYDFNVIHILKSLLRDEI